MNQPIEVLIRYDGLDAEKHEIELSALGESLQGISKVIAVAGHFAATGQYAKQSQALAVRVMVREARANCYSVGAILQFARDQGLFQGGLGALITAVISVVLTKRSGRKEEMQALKESLLSAIHALGNRDQNAIDRLLATVERMADMLQPSVRQAVAPIGKSCASLRIGSGPIIDQLAADAIRSAEPLTVTPEQNWSVLISELDKESATAKVRLMPENDTGEKRLKARITDPAIQTARDPYSTALSEARVIEVRGKASINEDGELTELYISNTV